jgi:hypothetical protein
MVMKDAAIPAIPIPYARIAETPAMDTKAIGQCDRVSNWKEGNTRRKTNTEGRRKATEMGASTLWLTDVSKGNFLRESAVEGRGVFGGSVELRGDAQVDMYWRVTPPPFASMPV